MTETTPPPARRRSSLDRARGPSSPWMFAAATGDRRTSALLAAVGLAEDEARRITAGDSGMAEPFICAIGNETPGAISGTVGIERLAGLLAVLLADATGQQPASVLTAVALGIARAAWDGPPP